MYSFSVDPVAVNRILVVPLGKAGEPEVLNVYVPGVFVTVKAGVSVCQ